MLQHYHSRCLGKVQESHLTHGHARFPVVLALAWPFVSGAAITSRHPIKDRDADEMV